jgi:hypothetical protein
MQTGESMTVSSRIIISDQIYSFVDRDMMMRYHFGLGVGHIYAHGLVYSGSQPQNEIEPNTNDNNEEYGLMDAAGEAVEDDANRDTNIPEGEDSNEGCLDPNTNDNDEECGLMDAAGEVMEDGVNRDTNIPEGEDSNEGCLDEGCSDEDLDSHGSDSSSYEGQGEDMDDEEFALMEEMYG